MAQALVRRLLLLGSWVVLGACTGLVGDGPAGGGKALGAGGKIVFGGDRFVSSGWRTQANVLTADAGHWVNTFGGDQPNQFDDAGIAPWFTGLGAGEL